MHLHSFLTALAVNVGIVFSAATPTAQEPCAKVASILSSSAKIQDSDGNLLVDADTAYACLKSVPLDKTGDLAQLKGMKTLVNFQSDLVYLKDPTPGYLYPGVDFVGSLDNIISNLENDQYDNEYDLQFDLWSLVTSAYDFHLVYTPDILSVFTWRREAYLVSVSTDGTSLPNVYDSVDLFALDKVNGTSYKSSPIVQINDTDVEEWLNQYAAFNPWDHDPDVNYNSQMFSPPALAAGIQPTFTYYSTHFPGSVTVFKFANGTTKNVQSYGSTYQDFSGVTDGKSFFQKFCSGPRPSASASAIASGSAFPSASASASAIPSVIVSNSISYVPSAVGSGSASAVASSSVTTQNSYTPLPTPLPSVKGPSFYPNPAVIESDGYMAGYFPEDISDLAVVSMPSFLPDNDYIFQNTFRKILATSKALGKTKLIIDVRGNGGGTVVDAFALFKELFPSMTPYGSSNLAAWDLLNAFGDTVTDEYKPAALDQLRPLTAEFDVDEDLTVKLTNYNSWADFYGPVEHHGGEFTNLRRYNYSSPYNGLGNALYGYGNNTRPQPQTFQSENIVLLSDGSCGSTCAIFAELLKTQGNVESIAVGGRKQYGPQQPVGGSKGSNDQDLALLVSSVNGGKDKATGDAKKTFEKYINAGLPAQAQQLLNRRASWNPTSNVNFQNNIRKGDNSATPLQFVYEAANCRFFYTPQMILDQSLVWKMTYNLQWGNGTCVKGSTGHPSAVTGFSTSYISSAAPDGAKNFFGANITWPLPGAYSPGDHVSTPSGSPSGSAPTSTHTGSAASLRVPQLGSGSGWTGVTSAAFTIFGAMMFL